MVGLTALQLPAIFSSYIPKKEIKMLVKATRCLTANFRLSPFLQQQLKVSFPASGAAVGAVMLVGYPVVSEVTAAVVACTQILLHLLLPCLLYQGFRIPSPSESFYLFFFICSSGKLSLSSLRLLLADLVRPENSFYGHFAQTSLS